MYLIVYIVLVGVWGLRDVMYLYLYFLPLELSEKEVYGDLWARVVLALILQISSRINELESAWDVYFNG